MKVFLDNNLSPRLAESMSALFADQHQIVHLRSKFMGSISDEEWISGLSAEGGWVVLSSDRRILRNPSERAALRSSSLTAFFLSRALAKVSVVRQLIRILQLWDVIELTTGTVQGGAAYELPEKSVKLRQLPY